MTEVRPLVSILMPCYKGHQYLPAAIESCLEQRYTNFELICVDDQSPDDCQKIIRSYAERDTRIRLVKRDTNGGQARAFQTGLEASRGEYVTRLAQDDVFYPGAIERLVEALQTHPEAGLVYGDTQRIDAEGRAKSLIQSKEPNEALFPRPHVGLYVMWRREVHAKTGGFNPDSCAEDFDLWLQISLHYPLHRIQANPGVGFRQHEAQTSNQQKRCGCDRIKAHIRYHRELLRRSPWSLKHRLKLMKSQLRYIYMTLTPVSMHESSGPE